MKPWLVFLSAAGGANWPIATYAAFLFPFLECRSIKPLFWSAVLGGGGGGGGGGQGAPFPNHPPFGRGSSGRLPKRPLLSQPPFPGEGGGGLFGIAHRVHFSAILDPKRCSVGGGQGSTQMSNQHKIQCPAPQAPVRHAAGTQEGEGWGYKQRTCTKAWPKEPLSAAPPPDNGGGGLAPPPPPQQQQRFLSPSSFSVVVADDTCNRYLNRLPHDVADTAEGQCETPMDGGSGPPFRFVGAQKCACGPGLSTRRQACAPDPSATPRHQRHADRGLRQGTPGGWIGGGFGMSPLGSCRCRRLLADRHSRPFPWTLSLHRRRCPWASHHLVPPIFLLGLSFPLYFPFLFLGLSLCRPRCPSASHHSFPFLSFGLLHQRSPGLSLFHGERGGGGGGGCGGPTHPHVRPPFLGQK